MALQGVNVRADGSDDVSEIAATFPNGVVRIVLLKNRDLSWYFDWCHQRGLLVWAVIAKESLEGFSDSFSAAEFYYNRYRGKIDYLQVGNEWDHVSGSSWTMTPGELYDLVWNFRNRWRNGTIPLVLGGAVSGDPNYLDAIQRTLGLVDGVSVHPYGQRAYPNEPAPAGDFGLATELFSAYQARLQELGFSLRLYASEWGVSSWEVGEERQAQYCGRFATMLKNNAQVRIAIHFCKHPYLGFGWQKEDNNSWKPIREALRKAVEGQQPLTEEGNTQMPEEFFFVFGMEKKVKELEAQGIKVGKAVEPETYPYPGSPYSYQMTENGLLVYSARANRVHFFKGAGA